MKFNNICKHESAAPAKLMQTLETNQGGPGRHKCCFCSFEAGLNSIYSKEELLQLADKRSKEFYKCPHGKVAPAIIFSAIPKSQGGIVRHRCATCAYWRGILSLSSASNDVEFNIVMTNPNFVPKKLKPHQGAPRKGVFVDSETNGRLGNLGELAAISFEKKSLLEVGKANLADLVEQVSVTEGDGLGYDVKSYNEDGTDKWIEVKTTTGNENSTFHISENQVCVSEAHPTRFHLYRIYDFNPEEKTGSLYTLRGGLRSQLFLTASSYKAFPK